LIGSTECPCQLKTLIEVSTRLISINTPSSYDFGILSVYIALLVFGNQKHGEKTQRRKT